MGYLFGGGASGLVSVKNVLDFGAIGDFVHDDTAAIQAAIDWTAGANRGTIFFPAGSYLISSSLTFNYNGNLSIRFMGDSCGVSSIGGNFNGYLFDRSLVTPNNTPGLRIFERLNFSNGGASGGCIRVGSSRGVAIRDCQFSGFINITTEDSAGNSSQNINIQNCQFSPNGTITGSHAIIIGGSGSIEGCGTMNGSDVFCRAYGAGLSTQGNRLERCGTAYLLGLDSAGTAAGCNGFSITSHTFEGHWTAIDLAGACSAFYIGNNQIQGHPSSNAGPTPSVQDSQYGIRVRADCASSGVFSGLNLSANYAVAAFSIANASARTNLLVRNTSASQSGSAGTAWSIPTNAYTASFENCNTRPIWTYSQLPTSTNRLEGDEFDISDCNTATWGATAAGSGSNHVRVRYNGTNYTVVGV